jgi:hypothetical protein
MKRILALLPLFLPFLAIAVPPVFGGNLPPLRSTHLAEDTPQFDLALSYLRMGDIARAPTLEWEVLWDPSGTYDYRGIDLAIKKMAMKGVIPLWLLQPAPYPTSPWYAATWNDWWMPKRELWPAIVTMNTNIAKHIFTESKKYRTYQPLIQLWNEPQGGKPGGSISSKFGEWVPQLHELLYMLVNDLRINGIPKAQIIGPAVSSFGENQRTEAAEFASMMPPPEFDWLSQCGYRAYHIRFSASWANGNVTNIRQGFQNVLDWVSWIGSRYKWPADQKVMVTEFYVTPGDCGVPIGTDMYPYHAIAFDLLNASSFSHVVGWGLRPGENGNANDPWQQYGGLGPSLVRWRG